MLKSKVCLCLVQVTTYKIHTVQQIDTNLLDDVVDDDEALLRSFRIKTLANSPLNKSIPQVIRPLQKP